MKKIIYILIFSISLFANTLLLQEDFESTIDNNKWNVESGWQIENGSLTSSSQAFISTISQTFKDFNLSFDVTLQEDPSTLHINLFLLNGARYFVGVQATGFYIKKTDSNDNESDILSYYDYNFDINVTNKVTIYHHENNITIYKDDLALYSFSNNELSSQSGKIAFENPSSATISIDNIEIYSNKVLSLSSTKWTNLGGPIGGLGYDIRIDPQNSSTLYVSDNHAGVGKSLNKALSWERKNNGITIKGGITEDSVNIFSLTIDENNPNTIWAGTQGNGSSYGIFKTTDGGENWVNKINGLQIKDGETGLIIRGFTVEPNNSNTVYVQTEVLTEEMGREFRKSKGRVYKTTDGGENWSEIVEVDSLTRYLIIDPSDKNILYLSTGIFDVEAINSNCKNDLSNSVNRGGTGVYKSIDGGVSWSQINTGLKDLYVGTLRMDPKNSNILYAGVGNNACSNPNATDVGLYKTTNAGASWTQVISGSLISAVNIAPTDSNIVYAGGEAGFFKSTDKGVSWSEYTKNGYGFGPEGVYAGFPIDLVVDSNNSNTIYVNNYGGGVIKSVDGGVTWSLASSGISGALVNAIHINKNSDKRLYSVARSGAFLSENFGEDFKGISNSFYIAEYMNIISNPNNPDIIIATDEFEGSIARSNDGGKTFTKVFTHPSLNGDDSANRHGFKALAFDPNDSNTLYVGLASNRRKKDSAPRATLIPTLFKSTDGGLTYTALTTSFDSNSTNVIKFFNNSSTNFLVGTTNGLFITTDKGANFIQKLTNKWVEDITILNDKNLALVSVIEEGIYKVDLSDTSYQISGPYYNGFGSGSTPYITSIRVDDANSSILYAGDYYSGVYRSEDTAISWSSYPDYAMSGLLNKAVTDLEILNGILYASTEGGGIFRFGNPSSETLDGKTVLSLEAGWNLTTIPADLNVSIQKLNESNIIWKYTNGTWNGYSLKYADKLALIEGVGVIDTLYAGEGFWVNVDSPTDITFDSNISFNIYDRDIFKSAQNGWSLVGTTKDINTSVLLEKNPNIKIIWAYSNDTWQAISNSTDINNEISNFGYGPMQSIDKAHGFWILIN